MTLANLKQEIRVKKTGFSKSRKLSIANGLWIVFRMQLILYNDALTIPHFVHCQYRG
jgi:hypothetical protein